MKPNNLLRWRVLGNCSRDAGCTTYSFATAMISGGEGHWRRSCARLEELVVAAVQPPAARRQHRVRAALDGPVHSAALEPSGTASQELSTTPEPTGGPAAWNSEAGDQARADNCATRLDMLADQLRVALAKSSYRAKQMTARVIPTTPRTIAIRLSFLPGDMFMLPTLGPCRCTCQSM